MITQVIDATMNSIHGAFFLYYYTFVALLTDAEIGKFASNLPLLTCDLWAYFDRLLLIAAFWISAGLSLSTFYFLRFTKLYRRSLRPFLLGPVFGLGIKSAMAMFWGTWFSEK